MEYKNLTEYQKARFRRNCKCTVCGKRIMQYQKFQMQKLQNGRNYIYNFQHENCYMKEGESA